MDIRQIFQLETSVVPIFKQDIKTVNQEPSIMGLV